MIGSTIGRYHIIEKLGQGGMGVVYKARDTTLHRFVAIKILPPDRQVDDSQRQRFFQEARVASALNHPNIVVIHELLAHEGSDCIVMEYVAGRTLAQLIPRRGLPVGEVLNYATQIASGLSAAHEAGIVHRDLKPGNIMVTGHGLVKVLDFGVAKLRERASLGDETLTQTAERPVTEEGAILGTVAYMSPEQAQGKKVDSRSDIFSFGAVLYEMLAGHRPFNGDGNMATVSAILRDEPKPLETGGVPSELNRLVTRCLRKDPARRFQHTADLEVELEELKQESESGKLTRTVEVRPPRPIWPWVALSVIVVAGLGILWRENKSVSPAVLESAPVTSYPGNESSPTLSPDGKQIAFIWDGEPGKNQGADVYVTLSSGGGPPLRLTNDPVPESNPAWSPDGAQIAFYRGNSVYFVSPLGGPERKVADLAPLPPSHQHSIAWSPDAKWLAVTDQASERHRPGALLINVVTGAKRYLTTPEPPLFDDTHYAFSPDGSRFAFVRYVSASSADVYEMPVQGGEPVRLTNRGQSIADLGWIAGTGEIAFVSGGVLFRMRARPGAELMRPLGDRNDIGEFSVSSSGRMVFARMFSDSNIWQLGAGESTARRVAASTRVDSFPDLSPDGSRIAFSSDRTGRREIWVCDRDGQRLAQVTFLGADAHSVRWSPDGKLLVFSCLLNGNRDIYTVGPDGGGPRRLTTDSVEEGRPSFSRDGRWIYFYSFRSGTIMQIWKMPSEGGAAIQITKSGGHEALESWDGTRLYFTSWPSGEELKSVAAQGGDEKVEIAGVQSGRWAVVDKGIVYLRLHDPGRFEILFWDPGRGVTTQLASITATLWIPAGQGSVFSTNQTGNIFVWSQVDHHESDLMLVENFR